jgi:hypothetical protein
VAKGFTQKESEDFFDTYSPVTRLTTIRVLATLAASHGLLIHQMDVKIAFLNGELDEEIYMQQPDVLWHLVKRTRYADCENFYMALNMYPNSCTKSSIEL